jgi:hypothetical protein
MFKVVLDASHEQSGLSVSETADPDSSSAPEVSPSINIAYLRILSL